MVYPFRKRAPWVLDHHVIDLNTKETRLHSMYLFHSPIRLSSHTLPCCRALNNVVYKCLSRWNRFVWKNPVRLVLRCWYPNRTVFFNLFFLLSMSHNILQMRSSCLRNYCYFSLKHWGNIEINLRYSNLQRL